MNSSARHPEIQHQAAYLKQMHIITLSFFTSFIWIITGIINYRNGYPLYDLILALFSALLTAGVYFIFYRSGRHTLASIILLSYYCFVVTPFIWWSFEGMTIHTTYIIIAVTVGIITFTEARTQHILSICYIASTFIYSAADIIRATDQRHQILVELITFYIVLVILILLIYKAKKIDSHTTDRLSHLSLTDEMTQVFNHRYVTTKLAELERQQQHDYAICIFDIDDFKQINDEKGHFYGDKVLQSLCRITASKLRDFQDVLGRYGGDEFIIILQRTSLEDAEKTCIRICSAVEEHFIENTITISMGVCSRREYDTAQETLAEADERLYRAKELGKNRVCKEK